MGETSKLLLLVGFGYLCYKGVVNAEAAFTYIATVNGTDFYIWTGRSFYRRYFAESLWRRADYGRLLYADRLCICIQKGKSCFMQPQPV